MRSYWRLLPLLPCLAIFPWSTNSSPAAGPAGVEIAVRDMITAANTGDAKTVDGLLSREWAQFQVVAYDRDAAGNPLSAYGHEAVAKQLAGLNVKQEVTQVWGMCQSPEVGYAYAELLRTTGSGKEQKSERLRLTALAKYDGKRQGNHWEIFHWHVSPAAQEPFPLRGFTGTEAKSK